MRFLPASALALWLAAVLVSGCGTEEKRYVPNAGDGETTPTMATTDVSTLVSDSGYTRYHIETPLWQMFEDAENPFWRFPDGLAMEQYDLELNPVASVVCNSAIYFSRARLWRLDGNVVMVNTDADSFLTQQLFWDQNQRKIYSDSFIHIVRSDRIIEGYGFESEQNMRSYLVKRPTAILPVDRETLRRDSTLRDTSRSDTVRSRRPSERAKNVPKSAPPANDKSSGPESPFESVNSVRRTLPTKI